MGDALKLARLSQAIGGLSLPFSVRFWVGLGVVCWHMAVCFVMLVMLKPLPFLPPKPVALQMILVQALPQDQDDQADQANKDLPTNQNAPSVALDRSPVQTPKSKLQKKPAHQPLKTMAPQAGANLAFVDRQPVKHDAASATDEIKLPEQTTPVRELSSPIEHQARLLDGPSGDTKSSSLIADSPKPLASEVADQGSQAKTAVQATGLDSSSAGKSASEQVVEGPSKSQSKGQSNQSDLAGHKTGDSQQKADDWQNKVRLTIEKNLQYPPQALSKKWSGRPVLRIKIDQLGHVLSVDVVKPSGKKVLDMEAVSTVWRIKTLPKPPKELAAVGGVTFSIPVNFNYKDHL